MKYINRIAAVFGLVLLAGPVVAATPDDAKVILRSKLGSQIKQGMDFAAFRRVALADGWEPIANASKCQQQADRALCAKLPEIASVSSGPIEYNEMGYRNRQNGDLLDVVVTGDITAWGTADAKDLTVDTWTFGKAPD